jgi:flagellar hook-length control protein FliK
MPRVARPVSPDRASSPFDSLIEDTSPPAEPAPAQQASKVTKSDEKDAPAKSKDCKPAEATGDTKSAKTDTTAASDTPADEAVVEPGDTKIAKSGVIEVVDGIKPEADSKPTAGQGTDDAAAIPSTVSAATTASPDTISIAPAPTQAPNVTPDDVKQVGQPPQEAAVVTNVMSNKIKSPGDDLPKAAAEKKTDDGKGKQVDKADQVGTDQPMTETDDAFEILSKDAAPQHAEGKPQVSTDDGTKHHESQGRGDFTTTPHRSDAAAPTPPGADVSAAAKASNDVPTQPPIPGNAPHASEHAAAPAALVSQPGPQPAAIPLSGVAIEIAGKALAGKNRFEIRLDPPELGRIDVRLDVDRDGNVTSRLTVDRPDTLDLLRRDAAGLERALQDAGLKTANNGLQFSLRDQSTHEQHAGTSPGAAVLVANDENLPSIDLIPQRYRLAGQGGGLDIRV